MTFCKEMSSRVEEPFCKNICFLGIDTKYRSDLSKEVGKQYFRVTNDFYLVQLTMMKGGRSCNNT